MKIVEFLERRLGLDGVEKGSEYECICPFHNDTKPSFSVRLVPPYKYNCFSCPAGGSNIIGLTANHLDISYKEAVRMLGASGLGAASAAEIPEFSWGDADYLPEVSRVAYDFYRRALNRGGGLGYAAKRGFPPWLLSMFGFGYDKKSNSLVYPLRSVVDTSRMIGFGFRGVASKYRHLDCAVSGSAATMSPNINTSDTLIVGEGWADALRMYQLRGSLGYPAAATMSLNGSAINSDRVTFMAGFSTLLVAFDPDSAGERAFDLLSTRLSVRKVLFNGEDPGDSSKVKLKKLYTAAELPDSLC